MAEKKTAPPGAGAPPEPPNRRRGPLPFIYVSLGILLVFIVFVIYVS